MTKREKNEIVKWANSLSDSELEKAAGNVLYDCLGSQCDDMYELGYDMQDIIERQKYEKYLSEKCDILMNLCNDRGINLFQPVCEERELCGL